MLIVMILYRVFSMCVEWPSGVPKKKNNVELLIIFSFRSHSRNPDYENNKQKIKREKKKHLYHRDMKLEDTLKEWLYNWEGEWPNKNRFFIYLMSLLVIESFIIRFVTNTWINHAFSVHSTYSCLQNVNNNNNSNKSKQMLLIESPVQNVSSKPVPTLKVLCLSNGFFIQ